MKISKSLNSLDIVFLVCHSIRILQVSAVSQIPCKYSNYVNSKTSYYTHTVVSRIYAPLFCNLSACRKCKGGLYAGSDIYLANTPPLPVPRLDVDIGTLYCRPVEAANLPSLLILLSRSPSPRNSMVKID